MDLYSLDERRFHHAASAPLDSYDGSPADSFAVSSPTTEQDARYLVVVDVTAVASLSLEPHDTSTPEPVCAVAPGPLAATHGSDPAEEPPQP
jgi:hypothetical protein